MPLTEKEAQDLHEVGAHFASAAAALREAEIDIVYAQMHGYEDAHPTVMRGRVTQAHHDAVDQARDAWRKAHTKFHGLIDDLKETP